MLGNIIIYSLFFGLVSILNYIDYKRFNTLITPIGLLSLPFAFIVLLCIVLNPYIDFVNLNAQSLTCWIWGLVIWGITSQFANSIIFSNNRKLSSKNIEHSILFQTKIIKPNKLILLLIMIICCYFTLRFRSISSSLEVGSKEFGGEFMIGGIAGRLSNLLLIFIPYIVYVKINKALKIVLFLLLFFFIITYAAKIWMIGVFVVTIIVGISYQKVKLNFKIILLTCGSGLLLFSLYYYMLVPSDVFWAFIFRHFYFYITSGTLGMSEYYSIGQPNMTDNEYLLLPFVNGINSLFGEDTLTAHSSLYFHTDLNVSGTMTNVYSFFGTIHIFADPLFFVIFTFFICLLSYIFYQWAIKKDDIFLKIMSGYNLVILFYGWYNCGYNLLRYWEIFAYCVILYVLNNSTLRWKRY